MKPTSYERYLRRQNGEKWCGKCQCWKPFSDFNKDKFKSDGLTSNCKEHYNDISRQWRKDNPERERENHLRYIKANPNKAKEAAQRWRSKESNREKSRLYARQWTKNNPGYQSDWYERNKNERRKSIRRWRENNPDKITIYKHRYRAKKQDNGHEPYDPKYIYDRDNWICRICNKPVDKELKYPNRMSKSIDHIIPVSLGGADTEANVQLAHLTCNQRKNNKVDVTTPGG